MKGFKHTFQSAPPRGTHYSDFDSRGPGRGSYLLVFFEWRTCGWSCCFLKVAVAREKEAMALTVAAEVRAASTEVFSYPSYVFLKRLLSCYVTLLFGLHLGLKPTLHPFLSQSHL